MSKLSRQTLPAGAVRLLKSVRHFGYVCLEPVDYASRLINGKRDFPPLHLRRYVGPLRTFEMSGAEFMVYLQHICGLQPNERALDIGCGCGLMALHLKGFLDSQGEYAGLDIHKPSIDWCRGNISSKHQHLKFLHIDVENHIFNPKGRVAAADFTFPLASGTFDVILLKSVFTHMRPQDVDGYLREVARLLSPAGRCLATFFLLNGQQEELANQGLNALQFSFGADGWRYAQKNSPESAVAYDEAHVMSLIRKHGLRLKKPVIYGKWAGLTNGLSYQDMVLLEKAE